MSEVKANEIIREEVFGDIWAFLMDNYSNTDAELIEALLALDAASAILHKELGIPASVITVEDVE